MTIREVFYRQVLKTDGNGSCWIWEGNIGNHGYGRVQVCGSLFLTHRFSYELHNGDIPADKCVLHKCHNRLCVNPGHLYLGDAQDNARDWTEARRKEKLNEDNILPPIKRMDIAEMDAIKTSLAVNNYSRSKTAEQLGISTTTLWRKINKYNL